MKCPYCGGEILAVAKKCKHCHKWLQGENNSVQQNKYIQQQKENFQNQDDSDNINVNMITYVLLALVAVCFLAYMFGNGCSSNHESESYDVTSPVVEEPVILDTYEYDNNSHPSSEDDGSSNQYGNANEWE